ncbi:MAG: PaaI family thioesterase [Pseudomonadota bacterium]
MGILHGGMASAFADGALAWGIWGLVGRSGVTLKLNMTFMEAVREGDWLEARPRVTGIVGDIVHASADLVVGSEKLSARADAVFRARPKPARAQA